MSAFQIDPRAELTSPADEMAALPVIESPPLSPAMAALAAIEIEPGPADVPEATLEAPPKTSQVSSPEIAPEMKPVAPVSVVPPAATRFRATATEQIAAARARLEKRNLSSVMALALIASVAGAFGTVLANNAIASFNAPDTRVAQIALLNDAIARIEDDLAGLRGKVDRSVEVNLARDDETTARVERIEKAQAEPAAKLAKLGEAIDRLRSAHAQLMAQMSSSDVTGSIKPNGTTAKKPAIVEGWTLKEVDRDAALIEGKRGLFETYVGDTIPGVGRVEGFRKQDGHWVIVTAKGLIVSK